MPTRPIKKKGLMMCRGRDVEFLECNVLKDTNDFYDSWSPFNIFDAKAFNNKAIKMQKVPFCKDCINKLMTKYMSEGHSIEGALYLVCALNNTPYIAEKVKKTFEFVESESKRGSMVKNIFGVYYNGLSKEKSKHHLWLDFSSTDIDYKDIASKIEKLEIQKGDIQQLELDWGKQAELEDYSLLDYWFEELVEDRIVSKGEELLYRDLCLARLKKRKIEQYNPNSEKEVNDNISKIQTQINGLMKLLKIDNFQEKKQESIVERILESRIAIIERTKPAYHFRDLKKNEDFLGRGKYFYDHIYRAFKNVLTGSKLYNIVPDEEDDRNDEDYEKEMLNEEFREIEKSTDDEGE